MAGKAQLKPLTDAQREFAGQHVKLAYKFASRSRWFWTAQDEVLSAAALGLVEAAREFRPNQGAKFSTFASHRIKGALRDMAREFRPLGYRDAVGTDTPAVWAMSSLPHRETAPERVEPTDFIRSLESRDEFESLLRKLPVSHARVMRLVFEDAMTCVEAARILGLRQPRISGIIAESILILQGRFHEHRSRHRPRATANPKAEARRRHDAREAVHAIGDEATRTRRKAAVANPRRPATGHDGAAHGGHGEPEE
jgi:RNA polymerase sigma factor (sigma-70 family)